MMDWRQAWWQEFLTKYDFKIAYVKGGDNTVISAPLSPVAINSTPLSPVTITSVPPSPIHYPHWLTTVRADLNQPDTRQRTRGLDGLVG